MIRTLRAKAVMLRQRGKTYHEIRKALKIDVPKSTLSYWCRNVQLSAEQNMRIALLSVRNLSRGRAIALKLKKQSYKERIALFDKRNYALYEHFKTSKDARKIALAILYAAEGSKTKRGALMFGNSDHGIVGLFVALLRSVYSIDETKFRATVQCRADQDVNTLQRFWSNCTRIPSGQFYKAQIDKRTLHKPTRKIDYRGVCRIDYFSSEVDLELKHIAKELQKM